jgi:Ca2+-transporting ATPase
MDDGTTLIKRTKKQEQTVPGIEVVKGRFPSPQFGQYGMTVDDLTRVCDFDNRTSPGQVELMNTEYGGLEGMAYLLQTNLETGLALRESSSGATAAQKGKKGKDGKVAPFALVKRDMTAIDHKERQEIFGQNIIPPPESATILEIVWETIVDDPIIKILIIGAIVILILGSIIDPSKGWTEGVAIIIAVFIVLAVTAGNDWSKDRKFKKLLLLQTDKKVKVIRGGHKDQISSWDIVVGDIVECNFGDEIPADGIFIAGNRFVVDESPLTGESVPVKKGPTAPFLFSGCQVSEGSGTMLVTGVGPRSSGGKIQELLNEAQNEETVLQQKLKVVAVLIGKVGVAAGILTFIGLTVRWAIDWSNNVPENQSVSDRIKHLVENFVIGITVVVVAVPEGLPLAVTISLAFSMFKMIADKCFVRHLDASETMGEATCICTDKTGTLTENRMTVVKVLLGEKVYYGEGSGESNAKPFTLGTFESKARDILTEGICVNSTCFLKANDAGKPPIFVGSASEGALLVFCDKLNVNYDNVREKVKKVENGVWLFSSERKRMSTLVIPQAKSPSTDGSKYRLYTKGGSEIVLSLCTHMLNASGTAVTPMTPNDLAFIQRNIKRWASQGLRTMVLAYRDTNQQLMTMEDNNKDDPEHDLVFVGLVGIKDPLRKEVPGAVAICQRAGITVRMVTGDNILTASKIARECGIMYGSGTAMEGPVFRALTQEERIKALPKLQVLARSSPTDKHILVSLLRELGEVVAVTGDGTNDAPAMKEADVGFAMGISGTQIAMNASDIVLLDDNFVSIVQSIKWGRNVLNSVRKFLQFQLAVNLVAIVVTFIGSVVKGISPLNTIQLLWVNLIMDSFGALALATDEPEADVLEHPPHSRFEPLISIPMKEYMLSQIVYQVSTLIIILFGVDHLMPIDSPDPVYHEKRINTIIFTTFVFLQCANEVMARQLNGEIMIFRNLLKNRTFVIIQFIIILIQSLTVTVGQVFIGTVTMGLAEWLLCIIVSLVNLPFTFLWRVGFQVYHKYYPIETKKKIDPCLEEAEEAAGGEGKKVEGATHIPMSKMSKPADEDEDHQLIQKPPAPKSTRFSNIDQEPEQETHRTAEPVPLSSKSRSGSLVEMMIRKDHTPMQTKGAATRSRSSLSLNRSREGLS